MALIKKISKIALLAVAITLTGCGENSKSNSDNSNILKVGVVPGPYRGMIDKHIKPIIEAKGYTIEYVEFIDYVQPDSALDAGDIDVNLMQHQKYLDSIVENQGMKITAVTNVPTLGLGVFSDKFSSLNDIEDNAKIGIPADAVNLSRALNIAQKIGLVRLIENSEQKASTADITENPHNYVFVPMEAAQISRSLDSIDVGFVPGNYAYASGLDYNRALAVEEVTEPIKNVVAVSVKNKDSIGQLFKEAVESEEFVRSVEKDHSFDAFSRPAWWNKKNKSFFYLMGEDSTCAEVLPIRSIQ